MTESEGPPPVCAGRTSTFIVTALGAFVVSLDLSIVNVAFPALERSWPHTSRAGLAWVVTGYSIVFGSLLVTGGRSGDRIGRRRAFFGGLAVFALGSALCGIAPSVVLLVGGRVLQGVGAAFALPSSLGLLLGAYPAERRSQMVALWGGIGALAVATGPSLGAVIITAGGWRWAFYINLPVCALAILWGRRVLPESRGSSSGERSDYVGVVLISAALAGLVLAISEGSSWGWTDPRVIGALVASAVFVPVFIRRSGRHPEPVVDLSLFRSRTFQVANLATAVYAMGFFAMLLGNILFLTSVWHYSILRAGLAITPGPIVVALVASQSGRQAARRGFRAILVPGGLLMALGILWYVWRVGQTPHYVTEWLPATLATGLGIGLTFPVLSAAAASSLPPDRLSVGSAVNQTSRQIGGALGVALLVEILGVPHGAGQALTGFDHLWTFEAATSAATGLIALAMGPLRSAPLPLSQAPRVEDGLIQPGHVLL